MSYSFVYNRFTLGVVHEPVGMKPIGSAAFDWQYYLNLERYIWTLQKFVVAVFNALLLEHHFFLFP